MFRKTKVIGNRILLFQLASQVFGLVCLPRLKQILQLQFFLVTFPQKRVHPPGVGKAAELFRNTILIYLPKEADRENIGSLSWVLLLFDFLLSVHCEVFVLGSLTRIGLDGC